jgi:subtilisin family serine protease
MKYILSISSFIFLFSVHFIFALPYQPNEILIKTRTDLTSLQNTKNPLLQKYNIQNIQKIRRSKAPAHLFSFFFPEKKEALYKLRFKKNINLTKTITELKKDPRILHAQPNYLYQTLTTPNDPSLSLQPNLTSINMTAANWDQAASSPEIIIALIDTGIDYNHPDLANKIWANIDEIPNDGLDNDENGYIDDIRGWDFINITSIAESAKLENEDYETADNDPMDQHGHGTQMGGIIGAQTNNALGIASIGYNCKIMPLKTAFSYKKGTETSAYFYTSDLVDAIYYAIDNNANVINMSLGSVNSFIGTDLLFQQAVQAANQQNIILVAAAGNEKINFDLYNIIPASFSEVIAVSAVDQNNLFDSRYSNYGRSTDLAAPGTNILTTDLNNSYTRVTGTSISAAHVSGLAGLLLSQNSNINVYDYLTNTAQDKGASGKDLYYGYGIIDVAAALAYNTLNVGVESPDKTWQIINAPNPFNPLVESTYICYQLNKAATVNIYIYSLASNLIKHIVQENSSGYHEVEWNGRDAQNNILPNGVYLSIIKATSDEETIIKRNKIVILK